MDRYELVECLGSGSYSEVFKVIDPSTNSFAAMKRQRFDKHEHDGIPSVVLREAALLQDLEHPNIVKLREVQAEDNRVDFIFELMDMNLHSYMKLHGPFSNGRLKQPLLQCVRAIEFCHRHKIVHRDLKPLNILVKTATRQMKLADFGLARIIDGPSQPLTLDVVTLWYRAPEILLGNDHYGFGVDIWSLGCIAAEMATACALFPSDSQIAQLFKIFRILGTPTEQSWPGISKLPFYQSTFPCWQNTDFCVLRQRERDVLRSAGYDFLRSIFHCDPSKRLSSWKLSRHYFFENPLPEIRAIASSLTGKVSLSVAQFLAFTESTMYIQREVTTRVAVFLDIRVDCTLTMPSKIATLAMVAPH